MHPALRTTVIGSWPHEDHFQPALERYFRGELAPPAAEELLRAVAAVAIDQQRGVGLAVYTQVVRPPRTRSSCTSRAGCPACVPTSNAAAWDGRGTHQVVGSVGAPHGLGIAQAFRRERALAPELFKVTLPGPSEIATQFEPPAECRRTWPAANPATTPRDR